MPKTSITGELQAKLPGSRSFSKGSFELEWEGRHLILRRGRRKSTRIDLATTLRWGVVKKQVRVSRRTVERRIISIALPYKRASRDLQLGPPPEKFNTWLYWLLISIQKHANVYLSDGTLEDLTLKNSRVGKLRARRDMGSFVELHRHFVKSLQLYKQGTDLKLGRSGGSILGDSGRKYTGFKGVGKMGGSGTRLFITNKQAIDVVMGEDRDMIFHPPAEPVVVKVASVADISMGLEFEEATYDLIREARILAAIGEHENIVRIVDALAARDGIYMFLEKGEEDLTDRAERAKLTVQQFLLVALGILRGLAHMHNRRIFHLDIKPDNVLLFAGNVPKLIDFGLTISRTFDSRSDAETNWSGKGTPGYVPKECWGKTPTDKGQLSDYLAKRDSYATGMTFLDALIGPQLGLKYTGTNLMSPNHAERKRKWWHDQITLKLPRITDPSLMAFISLTLSMIDEDVRRRTTILQALDLLSAANPDLLRLRRAEKIKRSRQALKIFRHIHESVGDDIPIMAALVKHNE